ncbi:MAG TPA: FG-GAP-like repeat-containing protein [Nocardioidaceae bacterium]
MPENKSRFVLLSRQVLAVGTVAALAAPGVGVVSLDIVAPDHGTTQRDSRAGGPAATPLGLVASTPVKPKVKEIHLDGVERAGLHALSRRSAARVRSDHDVAALSAPAPVTGFATVGVTWSPREHLGEDQVSVMVRSLDHGEWSQWQPIEYDAEHGPDPDSEEARNARPGTDPIVVGDVDEVQVKVETADGEVPADTELALIDPEPTPNPRLSAPAIDTAKLPGESSVALSAATAPPDATGEGEAEMAGATVTPKPQIFSRAQWGADERMRDKSSLHYYEVHAGFVHHTVNANGYTRAQVPAMIRGIYAYHTQTKGWSDIGYNFLVDRFGRIWEGRYGGVDRPVVGAHTLNYNDYSFAMSALGNYQTAKPSSAMLDAYGRLFAWKLSLHGVSASSTRQWVGSRYFRAINGHRDAGQTACPGQYLYDRLPTIRSLAAQYQASFRSRQRSTNLAGSRWPDLVVRDKASNEAYVVRTGGQTNFAGGRKAVSGWSGMDLLAATRDLTGDGVPDMVARNANTLRTGVYPGTAQGGFGAPVLNTTRFSTADQITGVLDMTGDGLNDVVARMGTAKSLYLFPGNGTGGFRKKRKLADGWSGYGLTAGVGDLTGDGRNDLVARSSGQLFLVPGVRGGIGAPTLLSRGWGGYSVIAGAGDLTNDGKADLLVKNADSKLVSIFPGDGKGGLGAALGPFAQFKNLNYIAAVGQLAGNRRMDLVGRDGKGSMYVFANNGARNVEAVTDTGLKLGGTNLILNVGDWDGDGNGDIMTRTSSTGDLYLRPGDGRGGFGAPVLAAKGWGGVRLLAAVGDMTGDGHPDLMGQPSGMAMRIYPGNGATGFLRSYVAHSAITANRQLGFGLWNRDGAPDSLFRRSDGTLHMYSGNGPGGLMNATQVAGGTNQYDWLHAVGDATGDGRPDVIVRESATGKLWLLPRTRSGFGARRLVADGFADYDLS